MFLSGEREIRDTADVLTKLRPARVVDEFDVVPLYARLSAAEQHKVFERHTRRRVVLATNVAETSLTVPGIRYVVDPGIARISPVLAATKVQRLPIEPISPGLGQPADGPLRPGRGRHLHPALLRGGLRARARSSPTRRSCAPTSPR